MHRIALCGLVALAAVLGGAAVPTVAMAQPTSAARPVTAVAARTAEAGWIAEAARTAGLAWPADVARPTAEAAAAAAVGEPVISCVLATDCLGIESTSNLAVASGSGTSMIRSAATSALVRVARWDGSSWKGVGVALPKGTKSADLSAVSCKGAKSCLVVGDYYTSTSESAVPRPLTLSYNGTSLKPTPAVPLPKGATYAEIADVSCATTRYCVAFGEAVGTSPAFGEEGELTLIETWNGAKWTLHTITPSAGKEVVTSSVSCATSAFCVVTGISITETSSSVTPELYFAAWNGRKLTPMKPAVAGSSADLELPLSVSCADPSDCAVTGVTLDLSSSSGSTADLASWAEIWNGKAWQLATTPWPAGAAEAVTLGVSCYAAHSCEAVGAVSASGTSADAAAVSYSGTAGTLQTVPAPSKGDSNIFTGVSCLPWGTCVAVGLTGKDTASSPAAMTGLWNGKAWKLDPGF